MHSFISHLSPVNKMMGKCEQDKQRRFDNQHHNDLKLIEEYELDRQIRMKFLFH